jgi:hypothetical protein
LLLETATGTGVGDHTTLMIHKYALHAELMARLPVIDVDYCVAASEHGFGLKALRDFHEEDVIGNSFTSIIIQFMLFLFCLL